MASLTTPASCTEDPSHFGFYHSPLEKRPSSPRFEQTIRELGGVAGTQLSHHIRNCSNRELIERHWSSELQQPTPRVVQAGIDFNNAESVSIMVGKGGSIIKVFADLYKVVIFTPMKCDPPVFIVQGVCDHVIMATKKLIEIKQNIHELMAKSGKLELASFLGDVMITREMAVPQNLCGRIIGKQGLLISSIKRRCGVEIRSPMKVLEIKSIYYNSTGFKVGATVNFLISAYTPFDKDKWIALGHIRQAMQLLSIYLAWPSRKETYALSEKKNKEIYENNIRALKHLWPLDFQPESYEAALEIRLSISQEIQRLVELKSTTVCDFSVEKSPSSKRKDCFIATTNNQGNKFASTSSCVSPNDASLSEPHQFSKLKDSQEFSLCHNFLYLSPLADKSHGFTANVRRIF